MIDLPTLEARLERGWQLCEQERDPARRQSLEDYWLQLLAEYEDACRDAAGEHLPPSAQGELWRVPA